MDGLKEPCITLALFTGGLFELLFRLVGLYVTYFKASLKWPDGWLPLYVWGNSVLRD